ncbi:hypothetical protein CBD41_01560 [bacterium TMED181]|nr:hypothetical protein [Planctomycetota bacterium]OUW47070.1 MAG: hypothetical protein CBD41_01560 [bacterium TMED181]
MAPNCSKFEHLTLSSAVLQGCLASVLSFLALGCQADSTDLVSSPGSWLSDQTEATGLHFFHDNGMSGKRYFCEIVGPGVALLDIDADGDMDIALNQGHLLVNPEEDPPVRSISMPDQSRPGLRIFRNDGVRKGVPVFVDMTEETGVKSKVYGMGLAVSDVNNDGRPDLLVTGFGVDELWVSNDQGRYENRASEWGVDDERWTTSAIFVDIDRDGDEDLYVCSYVDFDLKNHKPCFGSTSLIDYCGPSSYPSLTDRFYLNDQYREFSDRTVESGIGAYEGAGLGVAASDLDGDGNLDFYVANDGEVNRLWLQTSPLQFSDSALLNGCALNREGQAEASMGAEIVDYDGDGDDDIFLTHLDGETNTLYRNAGKGYFDDVSVESGIGVPSRRWTGFGTVWIDFNNDSWPDLYVSNGAVKLPVERLAKGEIHPLGQPDQLYQNKAGQNFVVMNPDTVPDLQKETVGRGLAWSDLDNDGDADLVLTGNGEAARVLMNNVGQDKSWIGLVPRGPNGMPMAGVKIDLEDPGIEEGKDLSLTRWSRRGGSYLSSHDPRILMGLGNLKGPVNIKVTWPDRTESEVKGLQLGQYHVIQKAGH